VSVRKTKGTTLVSLRKRYRTEESPDREAPSVSTPPRGHPRQASPTETQPDIPKPAEPIEQPTNEPGPAEEAAQSAMKQRLAETERAAAMESEAINQQPRYAESQSHESPTVEQIIEATQLPDKAKRWLRAHPEYISDPAKNSAIIALHDTAKRRAGGEWTDTYFEKMEDLLDIRPAQRPNSGNGAQHQTTRAAPVRQQYSGPPIAAPPHRDVPSFSSGRPQGHRAPLTEAEVGIARAVGISDSQYREGKERLERLKASGVIQ
jgi:hypothetical protein